MRGSTFVRVFVFAAAWQHSVGMDSGRPETPRDNLVEEDPYELTEVTNSTINVVNFCK